MKELTILSTTDVHGFLTASAEKESGICSLSAIAENYHEPILIDNGDFFVGSPETTFFNTTMAVSPLVDLANQLGFDVMVPGNHDFDYGIGFLKQQVAAFKGKYLCANVLDLADNLIFDPYTIIERGDIKVGIIGVVTSAMPQISSYESIKELKFMDVLETLQHWVPVVKEQADIVVVSYHGGIEKDMVTGMPTQYDTGEDQTYRIISEVSGIDGLICGHQHRIHAGMLHNTAFVQPGYRGNYVGKLSFLVEAGTIIQKNAQLVDTTDYTPLTCQWYEKKNYEKWLSQTLDISQLNQYLHEKVAGTFYAIELAGKTRKDFLASFTPPYTLSTYHVSIDELKQVALTHEIAGITIEDGHIFPEQSSYQVTTNKQLFPAYRLETNYIYNVFDEYLAKISQSKN